MILDKIAQAHVHRIHTKLLTDFNHGFNLVDLVIADQSTNTRSHVHDFVRHHAATANFRQKGLAYNALEHERELRTHRLLFTLRERINHTVNRLYARVRMQRSERQVPDGEPS